MPISPLLGLLAVGRALGPQMAQSEWREAMLLPRLMVLLPLLMLLTLRLGSKMCFQNYRIGNFAQIILTPSLKHPWFLSILSHCLSWPYFGISRAFWLGYDRLQLCFPFKLPFPLHWIEDLRESHTVDFSRVLSRIFPCACIQSNNSFIPHSFHGTNNGSICLIQASNCRTTWLSLVRFPHWPLSGSWNLTMLFMD